MLIIWSRRYLDKVAYTRDRLNSDWAWVQHLLCPVNSKLCNLRSPNPNAHTRVSFLQSTLRVTCDRNQHAKRSLRKNTSGLKYTASIIATSRPFEMPQSVMKTTERLRMLLPTSSDIQIILSQPFRCFALTKQQWRNIQEGTEKWSIYSLLRLRDMIIQYLVDEVNEC